jgi:Rha family phage regulatory protein
MQDITHILADLTEIDGQPMTDSLKVAARFGKTHANVLRSIRGIKAEQPDFYLANFEEVIDTFTNGKGGKQSRKIIRMTKDGFVFLSMGFTGKDAAAWKIAYIGAFNCMAEQIARASHVPAVPLTLHEQAMKLHAESKTSEALASIYGRGLRKRRDEKPVFAQQVAMMERAMQLCIALNLPGLPDIE